MIYHICFIYPLPPATTKAQKDFNADVVKHNGHALLKMNTACNLQVSFIETDADNTPVTCLESAWTVEGHDQWVYCESIVTKFHFPSSGKDWEESETVMAYLYEKRDLVIPQFMFDTFPAAQS